MRTIAIDEDQISVILDHDPVLLFYFTRNKIVSEDQLTWWIHLKCLTIFQELSGKQLVSHRLKCESVKLTKFKVHLRNNYAKYIYIYIYISNQGFTKIRNSLTAKIYRAKPEK